MYNYNGSYTMTVLLAAALAFCGPTAGLPVHDEAAVDGDDCPDESGPANEPGPSKESRSSNESGSVAIAESAGPDDTPCSSVEGLWLSSRMETAFETAATGVAGMSDLRTIGSDWTGEMEDLFGNGGPVSAFVRQPSSDGAAATFVGHCRVVNGVDTITGVWVVASLDKDKLDYHMAIQPIADTLHRLKIIYR